jgi:superfamily II DNA or RNA helicase
VIALRPYQLKGADSTERVWAEHRSALRVGATGTGKTVEMVEMVRRARQQGHRTLIIVDSTELVIQTRDKIRSILGIDAEIEQADLRASVNPLFASDVVIATIQSLRSGGENGGPMRCERFAPDHFGRIIVDECHLSITATTIAVVEYFMNPEANPAGRLVGYTATPKRGDDASLAQLYEAVAFRYDIIDAIRDGYLVPVHGKVIRVQDVEISRVQHHDGDDFTNDQVSELMSSQGAIVEQAAGLLRVCDGTTIVFCPDVRHAELLTARLNDHTPGCADVVSGKTPKDERRAMIDRFRRGEIRFLCNCMVLTKGFDCDEIRYVAICRFTKSWALFTQMTGRGTRPLDGILNGLDAAEDRHKAIASSAKPHMTVLSFVGREGPMNLMGPSDALAGHMHPPEVSQRAQELMEEQDDLDAIDAIEQAEKELEQEKKRRLDSSSVLFSGGQVEEEETDLFDAAQFRVAMEHKADVPPRHQLAFLNMYGFSKKEVASWSGERVERVIDWVRDRHAKGLCTKKQANQIRRLYPRMSRDERLALTKGEAGRLMSEAMGARA